MSQCIENKQWKTKTLHNQITCVYLYVRRTGHVHEYVRLQDLHTHTHSQGTGVLLISAWAGEQPLKVSLSWWMCCSARASVVNLSHWRNSIASNFKRLSFICSHTQRATHVHTLSFSRFIFPAHFLSTTYVNTLTTRMTPPPKCTECIVRYTLEGVGQKAYHMLINDFSRNICLKLSYIQAKCGKLMTVWVQEVLNIIYYCLNLYTMCIYKYVILYSGLCCKRNLDLSEISWLNK